MSLLMSRSRSRSYEVHKRPIEPPSPPSVGRKYRDDDSRSGSREVTLRKKRKMSYDRSRSRSMGRHGHRSSRYERSRSRSFSPHKRRSDRRRSYSRSPYNDRWRHVGTRVSEKPKKSRCLGVFGLSVYTTKDQIIQIFSKYGSIEHVQVVVDASTGRSRGFCFVYFDRTEDATVARDHCTGMEIDNRRIRVDYSITLRPHEPTPGIYKGRSTRSHYERDRSDGRRRSPSPYRERRRRYSRSRSYSRERK
ncbi:transformer-2 protein homolog alpha isoform X2 [Bradysia coprophila]|uniref:transformer-2 protein homolog alpha isoform X2 n=1 Tax=Bradysia coprophila TaxID=38358 RepID=UPI00187D7C83|nr:transformer-2 protein homolog alpha isoform X2 [Bradysia coprophila]